jgi:hypothetical protein
MNISKTFAGLLTNKYFLYFIVVLTALNIIGYLIMNNTDAVIFFALLSFVMFNFSKNMTIVLLVSIVATNLLMVSKPFTTLEGYGKPGGGPKNARAGPGNGGDGMEFESFENKDGEEEETKEEEETEEEGMRPSQKRKEKMTPSRKKIKEKFKEGTTSKRREQFQSLSPAPVKKSSHIDYATTLEDAYKNLEKMLGDGGLQNLTSDTRKLMEQQSKLFNSMENITPLLAEAQKMMKGMDLESLNKFGASSKSFNKSDV